MRTLIVNVLLRLLGRQSYRPLEKREVENLLFNLANEEGFERLPDFLEQCADQYRNQFLYTKDERFRGTVLAFASLKDKILEKKTTVKNPKKKPKEKEEKAKPKRVSY